MNFRRGSHGLILLLAIFIASGCSSPKNVIIFCAGDSITAADYPRFLQRQLIKDGFRARAINHGRSGNTSAEYLAFLAKNQTRLAGQHPDFILLQLGTNDVRADRDRTSAGAFRSNMKKIVEIFRTFHNRKGKRSILLVSTIPPVPQGTPFPFTDRSRERVTAEINPIIKDICLEEKIPLVDNYAMFLKFPELLPGVHPSLEGYRRLAWNWYEALKALL
jgi:lysophospholipase L1-like esterase